MFSSSRNRTVAGWPFWLLIAAWFCANSPQMAVYELVSWMANARNFSHQQRLQNELVALLVGQRASESTQLEKHEAKQPIDLPVPADATLKKIELAVQRTSEFLPSGLRALMRVENAFHIPDMLRERPPHEPPRSGMVVV